MHTVVAPVSLLNTSKLRRRPATINGNTTATEKLRTNVATPRAQKALRGQRSAQFLPPVETQGQGLIII